MRQVRRRDSSAVILDRDRDEAAICCGANRHPATITAVSDRVRDQVLDGARDGGGIAAHLRQLVARAALDAHRVLLGETAALRESFVDRRAWIHGLVAPRRG